MYAVKKIIIADDHPLFREALHQAIKQVFKDLEVIDVDSFSTLQRGIRNHDDAELILLDLHMPGAVGFSALQYLGLECPEIPVLMISASETPEIVARAMNFGAAGFVPKSSQISVISEAMQKVLSGEIWLPDGMQDRINNLGDEVSDFTTKMATLTPKQFRILMMLTGGQLNKQIADSICVSEATVKAHLTEIYKKLGVNNRTQAATIAAKHLEVEEADSQAL
jgi:DNA-binding NarL/FixJ family response regulator